MADPFAPDPATLTEAPPRDSTGLREWRTLVEKALNGRDFSALQSRTRDGIVIEPIYPPRRDTQPLSGRGPAPWTILQIVDDPDPERANRHALDDLRGGAGGLVLRFAGPSSGAGRGLPATDEALRLALQGVDLAAIHLRIDPHPLTLATAGWLNDMVGRQGIAPELTDISWGLDPIPHLTLPQNASAQDPKLLAAAFKQLRKTGFGGALTGIDTRLVHETGGSEAQELAVLLAGAAWWLRALDDSGVEPAAALPYFAASVAVDHDQFLSIAKLRAARLLWARFLEVCGDSPARLRIHAQTSRRMMTRSDPHANLLRATIAAFAAAVGGTDSLAVLPFDTALGRPDGGARTLARNIQHLLLEESHLHKVADASAGSGLAEALTESLAETAWAEFQAIEREGGIIESLRVGAFQARVAHTRKELQDALVSGAIPLVGATVYREPAVDPHVFGEADRGADVAIGLAPVDLESLAKAVA